MISADLSIKQGDTEPLLTKTLEYADLTPVDLDGKTVTLQMRSLTASQPVTLTGTMSVLDASTGQVSYKFSAADTAMSGNYMATFVVTSGPDTMTFPSDGYLWVRVEENLVTAGGQQLVSLPDVKDALNISGNDHSRDAKLIRWISAVRPIVEQYTGPIIIQQFEEWHDGGQTYIMLRRRPSTAFGTSPVVTLIACSEYNGPIEWPLAIVASPDLGGVYSCMLDARLGRVVRRSAGGGVQGFPYGPEAVHVVYEAGQASVPDNVYEGTLELLRENYQTSQPVGSGSQTLEDAGDSHDMTPGIFVSRRVKQLLAPNRRFPALA